MNAFLRAVSSLIFPRSCLCCGVLLPAGARKDPLFCPDCLGRIHFIGSPLCPCCGRPFLKAAGDDHLCGACLRVQPRFQSAQALFLYEDPIKGLIHDFKYGGKTALLPGLSYLSRHLPRPADLARAELILPVPLHRTRLRERGFNQALLLARAFFPGDPRIRADLLRRVRATPAQTGFSGEDRRKNLKNAFALKSPKQVEGRSILLIDDVFTTGSTVNECATCLHNAGAAEVLVLTLARVRED